MVKVFSIFNWRDPPLNLELDSYVLKLAKRFGFAARLLGDNHEGLSFKGTEFFCLASTYKIAIAVDVLRTIDEGRLSLDDSVNLSNRVISEHAELDSTSHLTRGGKYLIRNLLELMLIDSDNIASDALLDIVGGPESVNRRIRALGISDLIVSSTTSEMLLKVIGSDGGLDYCASVEDKWSSLRRNLVFTQAARDKSTPMAMIKLLASIDEGAALSSESRVWLLDTMSRCHTGDRRIRGMLPSETVVAHKTGTLGGVVNDVGIVRLPDHRRFAIAVFTESDSDDSDSRDLVIAEISRAVYRYFEQN